jgi:hypothetical protein
MSYNLVKLIGGPIETIEGAQRLAVRLFLEIAHHHGDMEARRIFAARGKEPTPTEINELKGWNILRLYDLMPQKNKAELARQIIAANEKLPDTEQLTPRRRPTFPTVYHYIGELLRERKDAIAAGSWKGPGPEYWEDWNE